MLLTLENGETRWNGAVSTSFRGFEAEAFSILDRLRAEPHIERYRKEKDAIVSAIKAPFEAYRDDLVVNWVLPSGLDLETERNVFSRFLKNDFGAGGCHDHRWLSFYRRGRTRLRDVQLVHSLRPEGLRVGVYIAREMGDVYATWRDAVREDADWFERLLKPLLHYMIYFRFQRNSKWHLRLPTALADVEWSRLTALWVYRDLPRAEVISKREGILTTSLGIIGDLWPLYRDLMCRTRPGLPVSSPGINS